MELDDIETVEAQTPAATEPVSQREEVHNDVAEAIRQLKAPKEPDAPVDEQPAPVAKADHPNDPNRYADGTFKKTKAEIAAEAAPAPEITAPDAAPKLPTQPSTVAVDAPGPWAADAKAEWSKLPPAVQAAVMKREAEMNEGGRQWSDQKRRYEAILAPAAQAFQARNLSVEDGLNRLLSAQDFLDREPASAIAWLAKSYGVDLQNLASNPPAPQPQLQSDPRVQQLAQQYSTLESQLNGFLQSQTMGVIESFAKDKPYYAEVESELLKIIPIVKAENPDANPQAVLEKAYDQAVWLNQTVREKLIADRQQAQQQQQTDAIKAKAAQAAKAAVSVKGSSNGVATPSRKPTMVDESVYDTVRRTLHELRQQ